jgi:hypothetical protein
VHNFGRADQVDRDGPKRLVESINRVLGQSDVVTPGTPAIPQIELDRVFELGSVLAARKPGRLNSSRCSLNITSTNAPERSMAW